MWGSGPGNGALTPPRAAYSVGFFYAHTTRIGPTGPPFHGNIRRRIPARFTALSTLTGPARGKRTHRRPRGLPSPCSSPHDCDAHHPGSRGKLPGSRLPEPAGSLQGGSQAHLGRTRYGQRHQQPSAQLRAFHHPVQRGAIHGRRWPSTAPRSAAAPSPSPGMTGTAARPEPVRPLLVQRVQHRLLQFGGGADRLDDHICVVQPLPEGVHRARWSTKLGVRSRVARVASPFADGMGHVGSCTQQPKPDH